MAESASYNLPLKALSTRTTNEICSILNTPMIIPADNGLLRDWRGLSELFRIDFALIEHQPNPTLKILQLAGKNSEEHNTIKVLIVFLETLDRYDVIDDYQEWIDCDVQQFVAIQLETQALQACRNISYDAMVLYAESDVDFAYELVDKMEKIYGLHLFVKDRNLRAGDQEVQATLSVIADHSNKLILILSPNFLNSPMNKFFLDYAQTIAIEHQTRKLIPCMLEQCKIPMQLEGLFVLYYSENGRWGSFWSRLQNSITNTETVVTRTNNLAITMPTTQNTAACSKLSKSDTTHTTVSNKSKKQMLPAQPTKKNAPSPPTATLLQESASVCASDSFQATAATPSTSTSKVRGKKVKEFVTKLIPKTIRKKTKKQKEKEKIAVAI